MNMPNYFFFNVFAMFLKIFADNNCRLFLRAESKVITAKHV